MIDASGLYSDALQLARDEPVEAITRLKERAGSGDIAAKFQLAVVLARAGLMSGILTGDKTLDRDQVAAVALFKELQAVNVDGAAYCLGYLHRRSDPELAKDLLRAAAERNDLWSSSAWLVLGCLLQVEGSEEAVGWLERAVASGREDGLAYLYLGRAIEDADEDRALALYGLAYQAGVKEAYWSAGRILQLKGDKGEARRLYEIGARLGEVGSMLALYHLFRRTDRLSALKWLYRYFRAGGPRRMYREFYRAEMKRTTK